MMQKSILSFCLLAAITLSVGCEQVKETPKQAEVPVATHKVALPLIKDSTYSHEYVAEIHSLKYVEVRSKVKGYIEEIHVDEGQKVKEGQLLFTLKSLVLQKELQQANAVYKNALADYKAAEVDLNNVKRLVDKNIIAMAEWEVAKAKAEALKADIDEAKAAQEKASLQLSFAQIRAPYHGVINRIPNKVGSLIDEGAMLTSISDNAEVFAYFNLSEIDYLNYLAAGEKTQTVHLKLANNSAYPYPGKVEAIESEFDPATGNIAFRARFPNPDGLLKHGAHGEVVVSKQFKAAMLVPQKSTFEVQDKLYIYVVGADGVLKQRNIVPKMRFPDFYAVDSGLESGERFLFEGAENARDGDKINQELVDLNAVMVDAESAKS